MHLYYGQVTIGQGNDKVANKVLSCPDRDYIQVLDTKNDQVNK